MTGDELKRLRERTGLTAAAFARALGYNGKNPGLVVWRFEQPPGHPWARPIPERVARLAAMFARHGVPKNLTRKQPKSGESR